MYKSVLVLAAGTFALAAYVGVRPPVPAQPAPSSEPAKPTAQSIPNPVQDASLAGNGLASAQLRRSGDGHFYAEARVNGAPVRFLVDTGASVVALTKADAQAIGLQFNTTEFTGTGQGAGGNLALKPIILERLAVGNVEAQNVQAVIGDDSLTQSLLGQSFLSRVGTLKIEGDRMELR